MSNVWIGPRQYDAVKERLALLCHFPQEVTLTDRLIIAFALVTGFKLCRRGTCPADAIRIRNRRGTIEVTVDRYGNQVKGSK